MTLTSRNLQRNQYQIALRWGKIKSASDKIASVSKTASDKDKAIYVASLDINLGNTHDHTWYFTLLSYNMRYFKPVGMK